MAPNVVKVCKASNARKLAFAYLSRSHGRLYETCHFSGLVELSSLGKRRQKCASSLLSLWEKCTLFRMKRLLMFFFSVSLLAMTTLVACGDSSSADSDSSSESNDAKGKFVDSRDGQTYKTVTIGTQTWMAENLNFKVDSSFCYQDEEKNCDKYGRLYTLAAAIDRPESECGSGHTCSMPLGNIQGVCPEGWHLPSVKEWNVLIAALGGDEIAGPKLRSTEWKCGGGEYRIAEDGTNASGFSALPAGYKSYFRYESGISFFWTSSIGGIDDYNYFASIRLTCFLPDDVSEEFSQKSEGFSVRCLQDDENQSSNVDSTGSESVEGIVGSMTDSRDGQTYKTVTIGSQTWMAENLNYEADSSLSNNNESVDSAKHERLYTWAAAVGMSEEDCGRERTCYVLPSGNVQGVCPSGWHLPSKAEWETLFASVGGSLTEAKSLISIVGWNDESDANFWSATEFGNYSAYHMGQTNDGVRLYYGSKKFEFPVRCIQD